MSQTYIVTQDSSTDDWWTSPYWILKIAFDSDAVIVPTWSVHYADESFTRQPGKALTVMVAPVQERRA